jgi:hypothetical protein
MFRSRFVIAALCGVLLVGSARAAEPAAAKVITPETKGFLHVRVGDVWTADVAKQLRTFVAQAGPGMIADFENSFYPAPSDIESFTVLLTDTKFRDVLPAGRPIERSPVWVITSKKPLERGELLKTMAKTGQPRKHGGKDYFFDEAQWSGLLILDANSYAYASEDSIVALIDRMAKGGASPLSAVLAREADRHPVTIGVNVSLLATPDLVKGVPPEFTPLLKAKTLVAALDLKGKTTASVALEFGTVDEAKDGLKAAQAAVQLGRGLIGQGLTFVEQRARREPGKGPSGVQQFPETVGFLLAAAGLKQLDALLGAMPVEQKDTTVRAALELDSVLPGGSTALSIAAVAMAIGIAVSDAERSDRSNLNPNNYDWTERERNLMTVARAIEKYHKDKGHYPPPAILDKDGKPLLSWRVAILPYLDNAWINAEAPGEKQINGPKELYNLFKLDEPWDGPNNKKLITKLPSVYRAPWSLMTYNQSSIGKTMTMAVVGKGGIFDPTKKTVTETDVRDGLKHTLLLLQIEEAGHAVYWTKPADITLTADGKLPVDGPNFNRRFAVVYADASAHTLVNGLDPATFLGIFTRDGTEKLDEKTIRPDPIKGKGPNFEPVPVPDPPVLK